MPMTAAQDAEDLFVQSEFLALMRTQWRASTLAVLGVSAVQAGIAYPEMPLSAVLGWLVLVGLGQLLRGAILRRQLAGDDATAQRIRQYLWLAPVSGLLSGLYFWSFPALSDTSRCVVSLLFLGQLLGFISNGAGQPRLFLLYSLPIMLPLSAAWMLVPGNDYTARTGVGVGLLMLLAVTGLLYGLAARVWQLFDSSCRIRFRESALNARLRLALSAAEQANQAKTRFLAAASHDLRQPLHVIGMISAALSLRQLDPTTQGMVQVLGQVNSSLSSLLDSLLDISKLDAGLVPVNAQVVSVGKLMQRVFNTLLPLTEAKGLHAVLELQTDARIRTDPVLLVRILNNLNANALKFTVQGQICWRVWAQDGRVLLELADTGCGIAPEHQDAVFQEFFQVGNAQRDPSSGLGLGLSIVQRLSRLLGVQVSLRSVLGQGTQVRLSLPLHPGLDGGDDSLPPLQVEVAPRQLGLQVLVVDDEPAVQQASRLLLAELGCACRVADSLAQAQTLVATWRPDVIIADLRLRGALNGIETIATLRHQLGPVPALLMSGDTAPDRLQLARDAGIPLCHKPISLDALVRELDRVVSQAGAPG